MIRGRIRGRCLKRLLKRIHFSAAMTPGSESKGEGGGGEEEDGTRQKSPLGCYLVPSRSPAFPPS